MHHKSVFGMEIEQRACEPRNRREIAKSGPRYSELSPSIGFQNPIITRLPRHASQVTCRALVI